MLPTPKAAPSVALARRLELLLTCLCLRVIGPSGFLRSQRPAAGRKTGWCKILWERGLGPGIEFAGVASVPVQCANGQLCRAGDRPLRWPWPGSWLRFSGMLRLRLIMLLEERGFDATLGSSGRGRGSYLDSQRGVHTHCIVSVLLATPRFVDWMARF